MGGGGTASFRGICEGEDVADGERGVLAGVDELASVHALVGDEGLGVKLVAVGVAEDDAGERSTTRSRKKREFSFFGFLKSSKRFERTGQHRG